MTRQLFVFFILLAVGLMSCSNNLVEETVDLESTVEEKIIIGVIESYEPYIDINGGIASGPYIDIIKQVFDQLSYDYEIVVYPWSRLMKAVETGEVDLAFPFYDTPERRKIYYFAEETLSYSRLDMVSLAGVDFEFDGNYDSILGLEVGIVQDYYYSKAFENAVNDKLIKVDEAMSLDDNMEKLLEGRLKMIAINDIAFNQYVDDLDLDPKDFKIHQPIVVNNNHIVFTKAKDHLQLRIDVDKHIKQMKLDGSFYDIYRQHGYDKFADEYQQYEKENPAVRYFQNDSDDPIKVGILGDTKPYAYYEDEALVGFGVEFISEFLDRVGLEYQLVDLPFNRMLEELKSGSIDIGTDLYKKEERQAYVDYPQLPYAAYPTVIFKKSDMNLAFDGDLELLKNYTVSYIRGYYLGDLEAYKDSDEFTFIEVSSPEQNLEFLLNDRVDLMVDIKSTGENIIKNFDVEGQVEAVEPPIYYDYSYNVFSKANNLEKLMKEYEAIVNQMFEDGTIRQLSEKYGLDYLEFDELK